MGYAGTLLHGDARFVGPSNFLTGKPGWRVFIGDSAGSQLSDIAADAAILRAVGKPGGTGGNPTMYIRTGGAWQRDPRIADIADSTSGIISVNGAFIVTGDAGTGSIWRAPSRVAPFAKVLAGSFHTWHDVAFNGVGFVAVGGTEAARSADGIAWVISVPTGNIMRVCAVDSRFVSVGIGAIGSRARYSDDNGLTWPAVAAPPAKDLKDVAYNGQIVVAIGSADGVDANIFFSADQGQNWTEAANPRNVSLNGVAALPDGRFFAVGQDRGDHFPYCLIGSADGATWTDYLLPMPGANGVFLSRVRVFGRNLFAVGLYPAVAELIVCADVTKL